MKAEVLALFHMPQLSLIGLMIFFGFFLTMVLWLYRARSKPFYNHLANLPLGD